MNSREHAWNSSINDSRMAFARSKLLSIRPWWRPNLVLICLLAYSSLIPYVYGRGAWQFGEAEFASRLHEIASRSPISVLFMRAITISASFPCIGVASGIVAVWLLWRRDLPLLAGWLAALGGGGVLYVVLKCIYQRERPAFPEPIIMEFGASFPSGHSLGAAIVLTFAVFLMARIEVRPCTRFTCLTGLFVWFLAVGFSRVFLGVHFVSDVAAGYAVGAMWAAAATGVTESLSLSIVPLSRTTDSTRP